MGGDIKGLIARGIVRYLDGDHHEFKRLVNKAIDIEKRDKHLYVTIGELIEAKETA